MRSIVNTTLHQIPLALKLQLLSVISLWFYLIQFGLISQGNFFHLFQHLLPFGSFIVNLINHYLDGFLFFVGIHFITVLNIFTFGRGAFIRF